MDGYAAKPLALNKISQAYALVRTAEPSLTMERWRDVASAFLAPTNVGAQATRGIVTVQNQQGYILGLFCYAACDHLQHGRALSVERLMAADLFDAVGAMEILLRSMRDLAQNLDCPVILASAPANDSEWRRLATTWFCEEPEEGGTKRLLRLLDPAPCRPLRAGIERGG